MPIYDFKCPVCGEERELKFSMSEMKDSPDVICPNCGALMKKRVTASGIQWNCSGSTKNG